MQMYETQNDGSIRVLTTHEDHKEMMIFRKHQIRSQKHKLWLGITDLSSIPYENPLSIKEEQDLNRKIIENSIITPVVQGEEAFYNQRKTLSRYYNGEFKQNLVIKKIRTHTKDPIKYLLLTDKKLKIPQKYNEDSSSFVTSKMISITSLLYIMQLLEQESFLLALKEIEQIGVTKEELFQIFNLYNIDFEPKYIKSKEEIQSNLVLGNEKDIDANIKASEKILNLIRM